jgi:hypothetical protein
MKLNVNLPNSFPHEPPQGYTYETTESGSILVIFICNHSHFTYTSHSPIKSYWGTYDRKTECYFQADATSLKFNKVDIKRTTPYSAVNVKLNPLEMAFL